MAKARTRTYRGRTPEQQRAFNQARKAMHKRQAPDDVYESEEFEAIADTQVEVAAPVDVQRPKQSLKDRLLNQFKEDASVKRPSDKERDKRTEGLLSTVLPLTLSGMIAVYSRNFFPDDYKACAPSREEVSTILLPVFSVIARHVEIEGRASQDAIDLFTALLASITVTTRMLITAQEVRYGLNQRDTSERTENRPTNNISQFPGNRGGYNQATVAATHGNSGSQNGTIPPGYGQPNGVNGHTDGSNGDTGNGLSEAEKVAALFARDVEGRRRLGLL